MLVALWLAVPALAQSPLKPGASIPDFTEVTVDGQAIGSRTLAGKSVVIWFTNFDDGAIAAAPELIAACKKRGALEFLVLSLNGAYDGKARDFATRFNLGGRVVLDADGSTVRQFTGAFMEGVVPLHNLFAFDAQGKMTGHYHYPGMPPTQLEAELRRL